MGIFEKIFEKLSSESDFSELSIDLCKICKSSQGGSRCKKMTFYAIGVNRAGKMTVNEKGRPRKIILIAGNITDCFCRLCSTCGF